MSFLSEYWLHLIVVAGAIFLTAAFLFLTRAGGKRKEPKEELEGTEGLPFRAELSVTPEEVTLSRDELRVLKLEREILSYAIRRLYEAEAEGKISEEERGRLASGYTERMEEIKSMISRRESIVSLNKLEKMQDDLLKLFSERINDLNQKIEELRSKLKPVEKLEKEPIKSTTPLSTEKKEIETRFPTPPKSEADEKIDKIRSDIDKVLERLEKSEDEE